MSERLEREADHLTTMRARLPVALAAKARACLDVDRSLGEEPAWSATVMLSVLRDAIAIGGAA